MRHALCEMRRGLARGRGIAPDHRGSIDGRGLEHERRSVICRRGSVVMRVRVARVTHELLERRFGVWMAELGALVQLADCAGHVALRLEEDRVVPVGLHVLRVEPDRLAVARLSVGVIPELLQQAAEVRFREAIRLDPKLAGAHQNLGFLLFMQKRNADAEASFRQAARLNPNDDRPGKFLTLISWGGL